MISHLQPSQRRIYLVAILIGLVGLGLLYRATATPVKILVNDQGLVVNTHARTIGSTLRDAGIELQEGDQVFPDPSLPLKGVQAIEVKRGFPIYLEWNGEIREIFTTQKSITDFLASAGITFLPGDRVWIDGILTQDPEWILSDQDTFVIFRQAKTISLQIDVANVDIRSAGSTLGEALNEAGIEILEGDFVDPPLHTSLTNINHATLKRARPIIIHADGKSVEIHVVADSVGEALQKAGIAIVGLDYAIPDVGTPLPNDGQIRVVRVREEVLTEQVPLPFETVYEANPELEIDQISILDTGAYGITVRQVRVRYEEGQEISRILEGEWVAREPQPRRVGYGTKIVVRTLNTEHGPIEYWRALKMWATSYSPSRAGVPADYQWFGITACGKKLVKGLVAIDNRYIPFHTMMYVTGYGYAEACDIGGGVIGRWIDLGYSDDNYKSWHQYVTVYFLTPIPPANSITWIFP